MPRSDRISKESYKEENIFKKKTATICYYNVGILTNT